MTTTIGYIVYGINLKDCPWPVEATDLVENGLAEQKYSGKGDEPIFIGVSKNKINDCEDVTVDRLFELLSFSNEQIQQAQDKINIVLKDDELELPDEFKEWLKNQKLEAFITWASD